MADSLYFSKVRLVDGTEAEVCDEVARRTVVGGIQFIGITTTEITDGDGTNPVEIGGQPVTAVNGDIVVYSNKEFIFADNDSKWHEFGDTSDLGALALKDSVSASYTPAGTVSRPAVAVELTKATIREFQTNGIVLTDTVKEISADGSVTNGVVKEFATDGSVTSGTVKEMSSAGSVVAGLPNVPTTVVLPVLTMNVNGSTLELSWEGGSVVNGSAGVPTNVVLPTFRDANVVTSAIMPTSRDANVVTAATMPTSKETTVVTDVTMPTSKETSVVTGAVAQLEQAPVFTGAQATIESE